VEAQRIPMKKPLRYKAKKREQRRPEKKNVNVHKGLAGGFGRSKSLC
jgi:hypothetical protein